MKLNRLIKFLSLLLILLPPLELTANTLTNDGHQTTSQSSKNYKKNIAKLHALNKVIDTHLRLNENMLRTIAQSSCRDSLIYLFSQFNNDPKVKAGMDTVAKGLQNLPIAYANHGNVDNPWKSGNGTELLVKMLKHFSKWCVELPRIRGSYDNGLASIQYFSWFYYHNPAGQDFVQGRNPNKPSEILEVGRKFTKDFTLEYGRFMDSAASTRTIPEWIADPIIEIQDYQQQKPADYKNWNQFFARKLITDVKSQTIPSRPVTMANRDYVVVAPTDCIMNPLVQVIKKKGRNSKKLLENPLQANTVLDVKGIPLSLDELLSGVESRYKNKFIGGTGQSCVLMPNTYHHFHAPVDGKVVYISMIKTNTFGYYDWSNWVATSGNVGGSGTDFNQFRAYQRGVIIIEVSYQNLNHKVSKGYVAVIPVGLETIGSVVLNKAIKVGTQLKKGYTELGNFFYGGSLNILLYSKNLAGSSTQVRMGNQINLFKLGTP